LRLAAGLLLTAFLCAGCGGHSAWRKEAGAPGVERAALSQRGRPYHYGGTSPKTGFDCSGFTGWVYAQQGIQLPRDVEGQFHAGRRVDRADLAAGDLVFFDIDGQGPSHVGLYTGDGFFIHSPSAGGKVRTNALNQDYWSRRFAGARRVLP
jgi:cell wall-associated NlpC family hydrolase